MNTDLAESFIFFSGRPVRKSAGVGIKATKDERKCNKI